MPETAKQYAARRGVTRRTVINWIRRGFLIAARKGYGPTSAWLITDTKLPDDAISRQAVQPGHQATNAAMRAYLERQRQAGQPTSVEEVLRSTPPGAKEINASDLNRVMDEEPHYDPDPEYNQEPPAVVLEVRETLSTEDLDRRARRNVHT